MQVGLSTPGWQAGRLSFAGNGSLKEMRRNVLKCVSVSRAALRWRDARQRDELQVSSRAQASRPTVFDVGDLVLEITTQHYPLPTGVGGRLLRSFRENLANLVEDLPNGCAVILETGEGSGPWEAVHVTPQVTFGAVCSALG